MNVDVGETVEVLTRGVVFDHVAPQHHRPFFTGGTQGLSDVTYFVRHGRGWYRDQEGIAEGRGRRLAAIRRADSPARPVPSIIIKAGSGTGTGSAAV